jgi:predicted transcriptional regulator
MIVDRNAYPFFAALASKTRLMMVELLKEREMNISELANELGLSSTIIAKHVQVLESADIIRCRSVPGERGLQKRCRLIQNGFMLNFEPHRNYPEISVFDIPVGQYVDWSVKPTCGLMTTQGSIGYSDDERCFADPMRYKAGLLYLGHGYVEYVVPNYQNDSGSIEEIRMVLEICSEAPGWDNNWPSDIYFHVNGICLGYWTCPGDFGDKEGMFSPSWYSSGNNSQYGLLKQIVVNSCGSYVDGIQMSDVTIAELNLAGGKSIRLRIESPEDAPNPGGFNIFGKGFGNYDQNISVTIVRERRA